MTLSRIAIVGAGQAGGNAAVALREEGYGGEIVLLGAENDAPFGRPPLSKGYLRGEEDLSGWLVKPEDWYAGHDISLRPDAFVERLDTDGGRIVLADGTEIACDALCIATGCRPRHLDVPGADLEGIHVLRTRADADAIREAARKPGAKAVLVGMGFIGAEVAASLRQMNVDVTAVFPDEVPLARVLGPLVGRTIADIHSDRGVALVPGETAAEFRGSGGVVESVLTESGRTFACTFVVVGAGVIPNVEFLAESGVAVDRGVLVDAHGRTSVDDVFAAGDVSNHDHPLFGRIRVEHFNNAEKQGRHVARAMLGGTEPYDYVHTFWSDQYDDKIEYVGHAKEWDELVIRGDVDGREFVGFYLKDGQMRAAVGVNRGGDPEAEPDSELARCGQLIESGERTDAASLTDESAPIGAARRWPA